MSEGILDTSVVVDLGRIDRTELPDRQAITTITLGELAVGPLIAVDAAERARRLDHLRQVERAFRGAVLDYDFAAAQAFGGVMAGALSRGRTARRRSSDFQIAAIAVAQRLPLYTANVDDFAGIGGLVVMSVAPPTS